MTVRKATTADVTTCAAILEKMRARYQTYEPQFWKRSAKASALTQAFLNHLVAQEAVLFLVKERDSEVAGFITARPQPAPPVFEPGATAFADDFCVAEESDWKSVGAELLQEARAQLKARGFEQVIVVTAYRDDAKMAMLKSENLSLASAWWVGKP